MQRWWELYTYISAQWMDTLWFDASNDLRKLSSENTHPRYGKCKHFCGSSARTERRFWVDSRQLLDGSIVLPARVGTLNDQTIFLFARGTRMLMSGGVIEMNECREERMYSAWLLNVARSDADWPAPFVYTKIPDPDRCLFNGVREMSWARIEPIHPWQRNYRFTALSSVLPRAYLANYKNIPNKLSFWGLFSCFFPRKGRRS